MELQVYQPRCQACNILLSRVLRKSKRWSELLPGNTCSAGGGRALLEVVALRLLVFTLLEDHSSITWLVSSVASWSFELSEIVHVWFTE